MKDASEEELGNAGVAFGSASLSFSGSVYNRRQRFGKLFVFTGVWICGKVFRPWAGLGSDVNLGLSLDDPWSHTFLAPAAAA